MLSPLGSWTKKVWVWVPLLGNATRTSPAGTEYCFWSKWISSAITVRLGLAGAVGVELEPPPPPQAARARAGTRAKRQRRRRDIARSDVTGRHVAHTGAGSIDRRGRGCR